MKNEEMENFIQAGKIASEVREFSRKIVKDGILLVDIAEQLEKMIIEKGGFPAFPLNLSLNSQAAHYTPFKNDKTIFLGSPCISKTTSYLPRNSGITEYHFDSTSLFACQGGLIVIILSTKGLFCKTSFDI